MNIFQIFVLIISVSAFCFLLFQLWYFIENYDYILDFNNKYSKLEYVASPNIDFVDKSIFDPNDYQTNVDKKFRCASNNNTWYFVSEDGFSSNTSIQIGLTWSNETDCINNGFAVNNIILYDPCSLGPDAENDCNLLTQLMDSTS